MVFLIRLVTELSEAKVIIELLIFRIRFLGYLMEFKVSPFRLVLRSTWVRLRPFLVLMGIHFTFLVPSFHYVMTFSKRNVCTN